MTADFPTDWAGERLTELATVKARLGWKGLTADEYVREGFVFLATPNLKAHEIDFFNVNYITEWRYRESPEIQLAEGDVLLVKDGSTLGVTSIVRRLPRPATVNGSIAVLRPRSDVAPAFLYHYVCGRDFQKLVQDKKAGLGVPHLFQADLREFNVRVPPLPEQRQIAAVLDTVDEAIRRTEQIIAKLKQVKQGLLNDLLTRGIDDNGELRDPDRHPEQFKDSPLGRIPKGWEAVQLGSVYAERSKNGLYKPAKFHGRGPLMVQMGNIFRGMDVSFEGAGRVAVNASELSTFGLREGDLLFGRRSLVLEGAGKCALVRTLPEPSTFESSIVRVRLAHERVVPLFAALFLSSEGAYRDRRRFIRQVAVSGVSGGDIAEFSFVLPPTSEQQRICSYVETLDQQQAAETGELDKLRVLKNGLMEDLLTGRVRVTPLLEDAAE